MPDDALLENPSAPPPSLAPDSPPWGRVRLAAPEPWVRPEDYDPAVPAREGHHLTHLLWSRQVEAELGRSFHTTSLRLETPLAVQHESQWSLGLDARTRSLTLHWVRLVRDGRRIDQLQRERLRLIQRETQLERHVIDGSWTLLLVLEDVRPGDILETAYTYDWEHPIRPGGCELYFVVPPQTVVGRFRLSVLSAPERAPLRWLASADAPPLREESAAPAPAADAETPAATDAPPPAPRRRWLWEGSQLTPRTPEPNHPSTFLDYVWVQVTDLPDAGALARAVDAAWVARADAESVAALVAPGGLFARPAVVDRAAVLGLVRRIQDEFRYLSLDLETGGWLPSLPGEIVRRRHGDCKDLAWLAARLLTAWGVTARPVLVGTGLRERVADLLPMALLFNHAILEVECDGGARWFDLTERDQGGDYENGAVGWFARGLVLNGADGDLRAQPGRRAEGVYALRETILLDSRRDAASLVELRVRAEGWQADNLRRGRRGQGPEEYARQREQAAQRRFGQTARRRGTLQWRDNRAANVVEMIEAFEFNDPLQPDESGRRAIFDVPPNLVVQGFGLPEETERRGPWDMPFPLEVRHEIVVRAPSMGSSAGRRRRWDEPEFQARLDEPRRRGCWAKACRFRVGGPEVAPARIAAYRRTLEEFMRECGWRIYLPWGEAREHSDEAFGRLAAPDSVESVGGIFAPEAWERPAVGGGAEETDRRAAAVGGGGADTKLGPREGRSRRGGRRRQGRGLRLPPWTLPAGVGFALFVFAALVRSCLSQIP